MIDLEKIQVVEGSHVVQAPPVVVKTYKLYIHTIQFCTKDIVIRSKTSLRYIQGTFLKYTMKKKHSPDCYYRSKKKVSIKLVLHLLAVFDIMTNGHVIQLNTNQVIFLYKLTAINQTADVSNLQMMIFTTVVLKIVHCTNSSKSGVTRN